MDRITKTLIFDDKARDKILLGLQQVYEAVATTLGSRGRNVGIELNWGEPNIIHDGVTVARSIILKDPYENMAAQSILAAAERTNNLAGDGTTTATILAYAIYKEAHKAIAAENNPMALRDGIEKAVKTVIETLKKLAKDVKTSEELINVATISSANREMGELIAGAISKVGPTGVVTVQEGATSNVEVEYKEGMEFTNGLLSPLFMTDTSKMCAELESPVGKGDYPYILLINQKLTNEDFVTVLTPIFKEDPNGKVLIVADDYTPEAMSSLLLNKVRYGKYIIPVKSPEFGDHRTNFLSDIAVLTGSKVLGGESGMPINETLKLDMIGRCEKVVVTREQTLIVGGRGSKAELGKQIAGIKKLVEGNAGKEAKIGELDKLESRLSRLVGGVAVINVGAASAQETRELKERIYDAVNATKAAISEGIVPGGGVAFIKCVPAVEELMKTLEEEERIGAGIVKKALYYCTRRLVRNAGAEQPDFIVGKIAESKSKSLGYNVNTKQFEDLLEKGIIDPVKVSRTALEQAASTATMLMTTNVLIALDRNSEKEQEKQDIEGLGSWGD